MYYKKGRRFLFPLGFVLRFSCLYLLKYIGGEVLPQEKRSEEEKFKCLTSHFKSVIIYIQSFLPYLRCVVLDLFYSSSVSFNLPVVRPLKNCSVAGSDLKLWPCTSRAIMPYCLHLLLACFKVRSTEAFLSLRPSLCILKLHGCIPVL